MKLAHWLAVVVVTLVAAPAPAQTAGIQVGGPFEVETVKDVTYYVAADTDPNKHKLDVYYPKGQKNFPIVLFVHGGTWRSGDRKLYAPLGATLAKNGIGTVIISYRLSPAVQHPEHVKDVARAFAWTHANLAKYGGNVDQIFVSGHSAGGHLAALLATDESYLKEEKRSISEIKGAIPISGVYQITPIKIFEAAFGTDEASIKKASPLTHVREKLPPFCLVYAEKELPFLDQMAETMCKELKTCRCDATVHKIAGRDHASIIMRAAVSAEDVVTQTLLAFVAKHSDLKLKAK